ncbi:hypothetical protein [Mucilaginibacter gossypii]|uniref:hypothetical protein n=1 Tax=Mucilaginibacter gossypii TaxID=551996 RepID=UPI00115FA572|nr:hypothetical protein [Mucilaginibacter gossypii]
MFTKSTRRAVRPLLPVTRRASPIGTYRHRSIYPHNRKAGTGFLQGNNIVFCFGNIGIPNHFLFFNRKGLESGFTGISFDKYAWSTRPVFLGREELAFGDKSRHGSHSLIYLGRGVNGIWTFGMNYSLGAVGGCYALSVYGKRFKSRGDAPIDAIVELKNMLIKKIGSTDAVSDKEAVILATVRALKKHSFSWYN